MGLPVDILNSKLLISAEEKRDAPYCRDSYKYENCTAYDTVSTAEKPCYDVKFKNTD